MLKKLQNLLFEEDEDDFDEDEEEEIVPIRKPVQHKEPARPVSTPAPQPKPVVEVKEAAPEKPKPAMQRIDVTQPVEIRKPKLAETPKPKPVQEVSTPKPSPSLFVDETPAPAPVKPKKLGITVDDAPVQAKKPEPKSARPVQQRPSITPKPAKKEPTKNDSGYVFKPVISPIFGVDEKDLHALKNTTNKISEVEKQKSTGVRPQIISPIYGAGSDSRSEVKEQAVVPAVQKPASDRVRAATEDTIPEFSLDDILKARDEEVRKPAPKKASAGPTFPDLDFDDDEEETILIKRSDVK